MALTVRTEEEQTVTMIEGREHGAPQYTEDLAPIDLTPTDIDRVLFSYAAVRAIDRLNIHLLRHDIEQCDFEAHYGESADDVKYLLLSMLSYLNRPVIHDVFDKDHNTRCAWFHACLGTYSKKIFEQAKATRIATNSSSLLPLQLEILKDCGVTSPELDELLDEINELGGLVFNSGRKIETDAPHNEEFDDGWHVPYDRMSFDEKVAIVSRIDYLVYRAILLICR